MRNMTKTISIRLPQQMVDELESECRSSGATTSSIVRDALERHLLKSPEPMKTRRRWRLR